MNKQKMPGILFFFVFTTLLLGCGSEEIGSRYLPCSGPPEYWPTDDWRDIDPAEVGMDAGGLHQVYDYIANPNINEPIITGS